MNNDTNKALPKDELARLRKNELANRARVRAKGLPSVPVSVEALWLLQRGMCNCNVCKLKQPLVVGSIVIAHPDYTSGKHSPGHVPGNVWLWNDACNKREAPSETSGFHKSRRFEPASLTISEKREKPKAKRRHNLQKHPTLKRKIGGKTVPR